MRYLYARFTNYIGFYNGCGIKKLEIDFTKCKNNIVLICGINGSGKSTLLNSLNPFVDPNSCYIAGQEAGKVLKLLSNDGSIYEIIITSGIDSKGGRKQAKAFISKNGLELNENGNITSYKDIIFSEFDLDSNYISLTKLSSIDRGLGDKTPAERKKFAASIVDNLETYNEMYKTLNKKSLIFKSHINTLHTKIQNIGNKDELQMKLNVFKTQNESMSNEILELNNKMVEIQTRSTISQEDAKRLKELENKKKSVQDRLAELNNEIDLFFSKTHIERDKIYGEYEKDCKLLQTYQDSLKESEAEWKSLSNTVVSLSGSIHELEVLVESYSSSIDLEVEDRYNTMKSIIEDCKKELKELRLENIDTSDIDDLNSLILFYQSFISNIDHFYDGLDMSLLKYIAEDYNPDRTDKLMDEIESNTNLMNSKLARLKELQENFKLVAVLKDRPGSCKIDNCPFISEAIKASTKYGPYAVIEDEINLTANQIANLSSKILEYQKSLEESTLCDRKRTELYAISEDILRMSNVIKKFKEYDLYASNITEFFTNISKGYQFNNQRDPKRLIHTHNVLKELRSAYNNFNILQEQYKAMQDKLSMVEKNNALIEKNKVELERKRKEVDSKKSVVDNYISLIESLKKKMFNEEGYIIKLNQHNNIIEKDLTIVDTQIAEIKKQTTDLVETMGLVSIKDQIDTLNIRLQPIVTEIQRLSGQLTLLDNYYQEYKMYSTKFDMIETLKKYCSPTGGGIQTLFMQLYMSKTLDIANQILGMLFNGEYKLLDFIINQNEFRIPFIGSGLPVDDISSGSCSQIAMMGLAINMALFYQASTKYNIPRFDEIDSGLDTYNRERIISIFSHIIKLLNIDQAFIISHSIELDNSTVDIIKLKMYDNSDQVFLGNVIYDYEKEWRNQ